MGSIIHHFYISAFILVSFTSMIAESPDATTKEIKIEILAAKRAAATLDTLLRSAPSAQDFFKMHQTHLQIDQLDHAAANLKALIKKPSSEPK